MARSKRRRNAGMSTRQTATLAVVSATLAVATVAVIGNMRARRAIAICDTVGPAIGNVIGGVEAIRRGSTR